MWSRKAAARLRGAEEKVALREGAFADRAPRPVSSARGARGWGQQGAANRGLCFFRHAAANLHREAGVVINFADA